MSGVAPHQKEKALKFLKENDLLGKVENGLNQACLAAPPDPCGFLAEYFTREANTPVITDVRFISATGPDGFPQVTSQIQARVHNHQRFLSCGVAPRGLFQIVKTEQATEAETEEKEQEQVAADPIVECLPVGARTALELVDTNDGGEARNISTVLSRSGTARDVIKGLAVEDFRGVDEALATAGQTCFKEIGVQLACSLSLSAVASAARLKHTPPYQLLRDLAESDSMDRAVPVPFALALQVRGVASGKLKIKGVYIRSARQASTQDMIAQLSALTSALKAQLSSSKAGSLAGNATSSCAFCPSFDKLEHVVDLLTSVGQSLGMELGKDFFFGLDIGAAQLYDSKKSKYDVGGAKSSSELCAELVELTQSKGLALIIDPFRAVPEESEHWQQLTRTAHMHCRVICHEGIEGDVMQGATCLPVPPVIVSAEEPTEEERDERERKQTLPRFSGGLGVLAQEGTVTGLMDAVAAMHKLRLATAVVGGFSGLLSDDMLADIATAAGAHFILCGLPIGQSSSLYRRLLEIEAELEAEGRLMTQGTLATGQYSKPAKAKQPRRQLPQ